MKKRKIREELHGIPLEWPKTMSFDILRTIDNLPADAVVSVVCKWEDKSDQYRAQQMLNATRRQAHEKEYSWTPLNGVMFVIKATLRFIQYLFAQANLTAINIERDAYQY